MTTALDAVAIRAVAPDELAALAPAMARLMASAYPVLRATSDESLDRLATTLRESAGDPDSAWAIAVRDGELVGQMHLHDFTMNVRGRDALTGGVGAVAVALAHKRQGIARAMIAWYLDTYRRRGAPFAALYPFRLDFYRALGFGYGAPVYRYRFSPGTLRASGPRGRIRFLSEDDADAWIACYTRVRATTHGFMSRPRASALRALRDRELTVVGLERDGVLRGFLQTRVRVPADETLRNRDELLVHDLVAEDDDALDALLGYLRAQSDQFARVAIESADPALFLASDDPRDGSDVSVSPPAVHRVAEEGLGIMYRVLDVDAALAYLAPSREPFTLRLAVDDPLVAANSGARAYRFGPDAAPARVGGERYDATMAIGIADFSSLVMGSLRVRDLVRYRRTSLDPASLLPQIDEAFRSGTLPRCATRF
jgi:predicted acetyltransferase